MKGIEKGRKGRRQREREGENTDVIDVIVHM